MKVEEPFVPYGISQAIKISSDLEIVRKAKEGVNTETLWDFLKSINSSKMEFEEYLPQSLKTLSRKKVLDEAESERILSIMRVFQKADELFEDVSYFKKWLKLHNPYLGDTPASFLKTSTGCQVIYDEIGRMQHGIMA